MPTTHWTQTHKGTHPPTGRHRHRHMHKHTYTHDCPFAPNPTTHMHWLVLCIKLTSRHWSWLWLLHIQTPLQCPEHVCVVANVYSTTNRNQKRSICVHVCSALSAAVHTTFGPMRSIGPFLTTALVVGALGSMTITWGGQWGGSTRHMGQWAKSGWFILRYMLRMWVQWAQTILTRPRTISAPYSTVTYCSLSVVVM